MSSPNYNRFDIYTHNSLFEQNFDMSDYNNCHENFYDDTYDEYSLSESSIYSKFCINERLLSCNDSKNHSDINFCNTFYEESDVEVFFLF